jgi:G3E family GTPase
MRYKGIVAFEGMDHRVVFQGVHMVMGSDLGRRWDEHETRDSTLVFIGRNLPKADMLAHLERCLAPLSDAVTDSLKVS